MDYPKSENIGKWESEKYWVTAATWDTGYGPSFEIGIRSKAAPHCFRLIQSDWGDETVQIAGAAIKILLDGGMEPHDIGRIFR